MQGMQPAEQQRLDKQRVTKSRKLKANSGINDEAPTRRHEDESRYGEPPEPNEPRGEEEDVILWTLHEPPDFDRKLQELLQPGAPPSRAYDLSWERLRRVQAWDEKTNGQLRMMPWLSHKHFHRDNYDKMNVGMALNIMSVGTVRMLCYLRTVY